MNNPDPTATTVKSVTNLDQTVDNDDGTEPLVAAVLPDPVVADSGAATTATASTAAMPPNMPELSAPTEINPTTDTPTVIQPAIPDDQLTKIVPPSKATVGPSLFGYKPPSWANDFDHIRINRGKGSHKDSDTWALLVFDRLLKKHS